MNDMTGEGELVSRPSELNSDYSSDESASMGLMKNDEVNDPEGMNEEIKNKLFIKRIRNYMEEPPADFEFVEGYSTFTVENPEEKLVVGERFTGPVFQIRDYEFHLILIPQKKQQYWVFSLYLEGHPIEKNKNKLKEEAEDGDVDEVWSFPVQFAFVAWDPENTQLHKQNRTHFRFNQRVTDWGFVSFLDSRNSLDSQFFTNNKMNLTAYVRVIDDFTHVLYSDFRDYDSKKVTGYVGIENQGATCYLNSLIQSYFFTKNFRKKVYQIPTDDEISFDFDSYQEYKEQSHSVSLALQRIFYKLQTSPNAITSIELTHSFGWTTADAFQQHDVQELNRILMDRLENKMKGTQIDGCLNDIFVGKMSSFIRCINVDYESSRTEDFWDIQLNVKGLKNIQESFENYVELEILDGDNKYDASGYGLQDAEKGVIFENFPDVLHVQLKRYEYDFEIDNMAKINDKYEFFEEIDLKPYLSKNSPNYDENWVYKLHCVLVHQGDVSIGHYYAMIKPSEDDIWFKFDDERVSRVTKNTVFEEGFGRGPPLPYDRSMSRDEYQMHVIRHQTSAYMLVYIRESKVPEVLANVEESDIPHHISKQIEYENEQEMKIKKEKEEMHLYVSFKIYTDSTFSKYEGFDIGPNQEDVQNFDLELYDVESFPITLRILKAEPLASIYEKIAEVSGIDSKKIANLRLWNIFKRTNNTYRPDRPIESFLDDPKTSTVGDIAHILDSGVSRRKYSGSERPISLSLYLEDSTKDLKFLAKHSQIVSDDSINETLSSEYFYKVFNSANDELVSLDPITGTNNILLFIKYFSHKDQSLYGLSHIIVPQNSSLELIIDTLQQLYKKVNLEHLIFYEEVDHLRRCEIKREKTFYNCEIQSGDIICFSSRSPPTNNELKYKNFEDYYKFMQTRIHFTFKNLKRASEDDEDYVFIENETHNPNLDKEINVWLSYNSSYQDITSVIGEAISIPSEYIKLVIVSDTSKMDLKSNFDFAKNLSSSPKSSRYNIYYEILNLPLLEFEEMSLYSIFWVGNGICKEERHQFFLPRRSTVESLFNKLESKISLDPELRDDLFGWFADSNDRARSVANPEDLLDKKLTLIVGIFPHYKELFKSRGLNKDIVIINVFQIYLTVDNVHGIPFFFDIIKNESYLDAMSRLHKILGISEKEFKAVRIGITNGSNVEYVDSMDSSKIDLFYCFSKSNLSLIIDHPDRSRRASHNSSIMIKN